jgi:hypothetical protein
MIPSYSPLNQALPVWKIDDAKNLQVLAAPGMLHGDLVISSALPSVFRIDTNRSLCVPDVCTGLDKLEVTHMTDIQQSIHIIGCLITGLPWSSSSSDVLDAMRLRAERTEAQDAVEALIKLFDEKNPNLLKGIIQVRAVRT